MRSVDMTLCSSLAGETPFRFGVGERWNWQAKIPVDRPARKMARYPKNENTPSRFLASKEDVGVRGEIRMNERREVLFRTSS